MTLWTVVLNSYHSALIDEMNHQFSNEKPVLGLPRRTQDFSIPSTQDAGGIQALYVPVFNEPKNGGIIVAAESQFLKSFELKTIEEFHKKLSLRVGSEFAKRDIKPRIGQPERLEGSLPKGVNPPEKVVWIPFELKSSRAWLAVAV